MNIPELVKEQNFPDGGFIVVASGILNALKIRESNDIDLVVNPSLYDKLKAKGWAEINKGKYSVLESGPFEAGLCWDSDEDETPNLDDLLTNAIYIQGIPFASLERVIKWKTKKGRDKDIKDLKLIDEFLKSQQAKIQAAQEAQAQAEHQKKLDQADELITIILPTINNN